MALNLPTGTNCFRTDLVQQAAQRWWRPVTWDSESKTLNMYVLDGAACGDTHRSSSASCPRMAVPQHEQSPPNHAPRRSRPGD
jgi:hypothetical protein